MYTYIILCVSSYTYNKYLSILHNAGCTYGVVVPSCPIIIVYAINLLCVAVAVTQVLFLETLCSQ